MTIIGKDQKLPRRVNNADEAERTVNYLLRTDLPHYGYMMIPSRNLIGHPVRVMAYPRKDQPGTFMLFAMDERNNKERAALICRSHEMKRILTRRLFETREVWNDYLQKVERGEALPTVGLLHLSPK